MIGWPWARRPQEEDRAAEWPEDHTFSYWNAHISAEHDWTRNKWRQAYRLLAFSQVPYIFHLRITESDGRFLSPFLAGEVPA